jgi:subtilase family serine protease
MLNGNPVSDAVVHEISVNNSLFLTQDPTLPVSSYAPGIALGTFLSDGRGMFNYWTDAPLAEISGTLYTQVEQLYATYNGLTSNTVTVYIEPQTGSFYTNVALNRAGNALVGTVTFSDMKYVSYVNVSIGSGPGQYVNESFAPQFTDTLTGMPVSGVFNGVIPIDFTSLPANGPVVVSMVAEGYNDLSFIYSFLGFTFGTISVQNHIVWADPLVIQQPDTHNVNSLPGNSPYSFMLGYEGAMILGTVSAIAVAGGLVLIKHRKK